MNFIPCLSGLSPCVCACMPCLVVRLIHVYHCIFFSLCYYGYDFMSTRAYTWWRWYFEWFPSSTRVHMRPCLCVSLCSFMHMLQWISVHVWRLLFLVCDSVLRLSLDSCLLIHTLRLLLHKEQPTSCIHDCISAMRYTHIPRISESMIYVAPPSLLNSGLSQWLHTLAWTWTKHTTRTHMVEY